MAVKINYESDFKLTERYEARLVGIPFRFVYTTGSGQYMASYDGEAYVNCKSNEDGSITIIFNKHGLGVGKLKVRREFYVPDEDFPDGVYNIVSNDTTDIILVEGKTDNTDVEEEFNPPYIGGGGEIVSVEVVDNLESTDSTKALSANMGRQLAEDKQDALATYAEDEGGVTITTPKLNLRNVTRIHDAVFEGLQTQSPINLKGKTVIETQIDTGELKVLHRGSLLGFILRTVVNPQDRDGLYLVELLSTDGYTSYKYAFPAKSGELALKGDVLTSPSLTGIEIISEDEYNNKQTNGELSDTTMYVIV